jgi:hypothetical protein
MPQYFGILIIHAGCEQIRKSIQELIFTLFNGNQNALVDYFGLGKVAGLLASKGLLNPACLSVKSPLSEPPMNVPMTEEEEIELSNLMERMAASGLVIKGLK